jgi:isopenicillin N synthase-like dioxygenase
MNQETLDPSSQEVGDFKEAFNFGEFSNGKAQQPLTPFLASHESEISDFFETCRALCLKLLTLFGLGLGTSPPTWLSSRHSRDLGPSGSILRYLHYPSLSASPDYRPDVDIRAGAHSDYGSLTLLFQRPSQPGLEVLTPSGAWVPVPVFPPGTENDPSPPILVNIGDLLSYWTNGLLRSTVHRVIFPKKQDGTLGTDDRYSMAFFCHPANETKLDPVPSARVKERGSGEVQEGTEGTEGRVITALEHLHNKLKASYLGVDFDKKGE